MQTELTPDLEALERGDLRPPTRTVQVISSARARMGPVKACERWARAEGLRPGSDVAPTPAALLPVVQAWARKHGLPPPTNAGHVGKGLVWAGLKEWGRPLLLHTADARRLHALAKAAWPNGVPRAMRRQRVPREKLEPQHRPPLPSQPLTWAQAVALDHAGARRQPVVNSLGQAWPSGLHAVRHYRGKRPLIDQLSAAAWLRGEVASEPSSWRRTANLLAKAVDWNLHWQGAWWRRLTPHEVAAIPPEYVPGTPLPGFGWGLTCPTCGGHATPGAPWGTPRKPMPQRAMR